MLRINTTFNTVSFSTFLLFYCRGWCLVKTTHLTTSSSSSAPTRWKMGAPSRWSASTSRPAEATSSSSTKVRAVPAVELYCCRTDSTRKPHCRAINRVPRRRRQQFPVKILHLLRLQHKVNAVERMFNPVSTVRPFPRRHSTE